VRKPNEKPRKKLFLGNKKILMFPGEALGLSCSITAQPFFYWF